MPRRKFTDQQIKIILKEFDAGKAVEKVSRKYDVSERTLYRWKASQTSSAINQTLPLGEARDRLEDPSVIQRITDHLGDLPNSKRNRVASRVAELAQAIFCRPGGRRPATVTRTLREARKQVSLLLEHLDQVGEDAWMHALVDVLWEESPERGQLTDHPGTNNSICGAAARSGSEPDDRLVISERSS